MAKPKTCNESKNMKGCNCTYEPCSRKGMCCECIAYHRRSAELPACYFPANVEAEYDRSVACFVATVQQRGCAW
ncbi:MAG: hypothetical protein A2289_00065 [Deltaproteobacteria bacterium RIFOXYA12_FULL_58_15]|nr:MAG: hypothetical protein A2289_00065 [Deltaproteobacteria bacterium RIFOXYA12_FULL_58_15]